MRRYILSVTFLLSVVPPAFSQAAPPAPPPAAPLKPPADVLVFANGDQLTGKLERVVAGNVVFASDMAGELTIPVDKVKELRSGAQFALLRKGMPVKVRVPVPEGSVALSGGSFMVRPDTPAGVTVPAGSEISVPAKEVGYLIAKPEFDKEIAGKHSFFQGWNGQVSGGATLVRSTTAATTLTAGLNLIRAIPFVAWLAPHNRTTVNVNEAYGKNTSPGAIPQTAPPTPAVTTLSSIFHADTERDEYFSPRFYALGDVSFDHNYAQGLQLQQVYGGGVGWTPFRNARQELDIKADVHYEKQQFITEPVNGTTVTSTPTMNIIGSTVFESYRRNLPRRLVFTETATVLPAFNDSNAYSANGTAALAIPVFKRLSASISTTDNFLNDPAPGYRKNSYQFVTGVTYLLR